MPLNVHLRPVAEADLPLLERLTADAEEAGPFGFFGYRDLTHVRRDFAENSFLGPNSGRLAVGIGPQAAGSEFVGEVSWHRQQRGPTSHCWNIGIGLLASARGHGYGTVAQRLLAEYLFAHTQVNRVEAETEVDNTAERRALEKAGFTFEGVVRGSCFRAGAWRDMASYSIVRTDVGSG
jgi:RimJ/RimL family protein N-acetyltransferase